MIRWMTWRRSTATRKTGSCGCCTGTNSGTPWGATSRCTLMCVRVSGMRTGWRPPGCPRTRCPRRSRRRPRRGRIWPASSCRWTTWPTAAVDRLAAGLGPLADGYSAWLDEQEARIAELPAALRETAETAIFTARQCAGRIRAGIELLTSPPLPGTRRRSRRSGSRTRRWRCSGGTPPLPRYGNPKG